MSFMVSNDWVRVIHCTILAVYTRWDVDFHNSWCVVQYDVLTVPWPLAESQSTTYVTMRCQWTNCFSTVLPQWSSFFWAAQNHSVDRPLIIVSLQFRDSHLTLAWRKLLAHNYNCEFSLYIEFSSPDSAQYLSSQTAADGWSALSLIPPEIDTVPRLTLQNRSRSRIDESVMRSEPAVATESPRLRLSGRVRSNSISLY